MSLLHRLVALIVAWTPLWASAAESVSTTHRVVGNAAITGPWILANICFAGMRAQNSRSSLWRMVAFVLGFPLTLVTYFVVREGSERAYGVDIPKKSS
ncbi:MAG TPA: hypothetical protein VK025_08800 [Steroidobacter sp.]|nr:hypothetical protein [Steroidobacteraceae bacterium]HLS81488.1 hypothetical protein [Steroidobacter sp.]